MSDAERTPETQAVNSWLRNEQGSHELCMTWAREALKGSGGDLSAADRLMVLLMDWIVETTPDVGSGLYQDLMTRALGRVDWLDLAMDLIEDARA